MSNYEIEGKLIVKEEITQVSDSFKKREFVIEVVNERDEKFNDFLKFQLTQDKCSYLDKYSIGQTVKASFNIKGRKWEKEGKIGFFTTLECWKLFGAEKEQSNSNDTFGVNPLGIDSEVNEIPF
jgi:hypothetical protein